MRTKVLITVKAYPAISNKYGETVCTAGITEDGKWVRIYPIPFRKLDYNKQFKKYDWIELDLIRNKSDFRNESYRPLDLSTMKTLSHIDSDGNSWSERRESVLNKGPKIYTDLAELISEAQNKTTCLSIATFKPKNIKDFIYKPVSAEWDPRKLKKLEAKEAQGRLFDDNIENDIQNFELVAKLPYKFSFVFEDENNKESTMMIEDWETGMLYWNSLKRYNGDENLACEDVKKKYFDDFAKTKDYYFFLGTTQLHHYTAKNPFVIIGDFRPKHILQDSLF